MSATAPAHQEIQKKLLAVVAHDGTRVVHPEEENVQHGGDVERPVDLRNAIDNNVGQQHDGNITAAHKRAERKNVQKSSVGFACFFVDLPMETAYGQIDVGQKLRELSEVAAVLGHRQRMRRDWGIRPRSIRLLLLQLRF